MARPRIYKKENALPRVPSQIIDIALDDLEWMERDKNYRVNMNHWGHLNYDETIGVRYCSACLAGGVIAHTLDMQPNGSFPNGERSIDDVTLAARMFPGRISRQDVNTLYSLDAFRSGDLRAFLDQLGIYELTPEQLVALRQYKGAENIKDIDGFQVWFENDHTKYALNPKAFKAWARTVANVLEDMGL